ncbi:unnamed protein product [Schistosoma curassoni]|uniref:Uncharacterized protein n=1 Tax=Schistosoma curassoni TaxID=6186 RepID=A0A183JSD7_9TREM|nr:unnamed protein product [Schistosoma curassoni]
MTNNCFTPRLLICLKDVFNVEKMRLHLNVKYSHFRFAY